jgi:hypothetical protein
MPIEQRNPSNLGTDHTCCLTEGGQDVMPITGFPMVKLRSRSIPWVPWRSISGLGCPSERGDKAVSLQETVSSLAIAE